MTDSSSDAQTASEIQINVKGPSELKLQITISTDKTVLELKQAIADKSDVPADRQRLIYSGRVLKDEDVLSTYKIQSSHTIHMVKGAARSAASQPSAPQQLPNMQAGQNPHDPLTQLNSHLGYGLMAGLNPFAELGVNPNDPNMMQTMLNSPQFLQQMSSVMSNPAVLDQIIASNPQLQAMGPQVREVFRSERFRQMMYVLFLTLLYSDCQSNFLRDRSNPETLRMMLQMSNVMRDAGVGGAPSFPAPGLPSTARQAQGQQPPASNVPNAPLPPFLPFFPSIAPATPGSTPATPGTGAAPPNPYGGMPPLDPVMMQQMLAAMGGGAQAPRTRSVWADSERPLLPLQMRGLRRSGSKFSCK
ncbi:Deubiquitination-protection protein dph1 [Grifola frondosa]|uniref:Deubiquitination-protection protein dph1 n=1 Tax=Grifola frondosa TaxID=5627 RepID=A0A1C7LWI2_GRIFR|nr:Deubiquitination-protection protein dph1 [Grifola frondosa]